MKVLLLNPPAYKGVRFVREGRCEQRISAFQYNMVPISLLSTAALLRREGHDVHLTEATARGLTLDEVRREAAEVSPGLVLVNASTVTFRGDAHVAGMLRVLLPGAFIAAYGVHVTALPEESLLESTFDGVIRREPEATAAALAAALEAGDGLEGVQGLSYRLLRDGGGGRDIRHNEDRPFIEDLDDLPVPARDLIDHRHYPAPVSGRPHTLVSTSRGCPYGCTFCTARLYYGQRLRLRSPAGVGREIEQVLRETKVGLFTFWSDTFTLDRDHVLGICGELRARRLDVEWMCNSRVDRVDPEMLAGMAAAGCRVVSFGVESGSQAILDTVKKGITPSQVEEAFRSTRRAGLKSAAHVIFGLPGETPATIRETRRLIRRIRPDYVQFYGAIPFPGTPFYRQARDAGWLRAEDWDDFELNREILSTPGLSARQLRRCRRNAFLTFYLNPAYLAARLAEVRRPGDVAKLAAAGWNFLRSWVFTPDKA